MNTDGIGRVSYLNTGMSDDPKRKRERERVKTRLEGGPGETRNRGEEPMMDR